MTSERRLREAEAAAIEELGRLTTSGSLPLIHTDGRTLQPFRSAGAKGAVVVGGHVIALRVLASGLTHVPSSIGHLVALRELDLSGNRPSELPEEVGVLKSLTHLYLYEDGLVALPSCSRCCT